MHTLPPVEKMYKALQSRDESFIGVFLVAVKTTKIFCRPGCPARVPLLENVEFFVNSREALYAGYRPCKRCHPMDAGKKPPEWVRTLLDTLDENPTERITDSDLREMGIQPEAARRWFNSNYGMTFQAYCRSRRLGKALASVRKGQDVSTAAIDHGYNSESGFRDAFDKLFGTYPKPKMNVQTMESRWIVTPLGAMLAVANSNGLALLEFIDRRMLETQISRIKKRLGCVILPGKNEVLHQTEVEICQYFAGERQEFSVPLNLKGTPFQEAVWKELIRIPYGKVSTYMETARNIGNEKAVRAVGTANGDNRIAIIVPCHRVIKSDGSLCGYGGGIWRKQRLLELESGQGKLL